MKATSLIALCSLIFTLLTSGGGCEDKSATGGKSVTTSGSSRTTSHSSRVPINSTIGILLAAGLGLGAITILKRNRRNIAGDL